MKDKIVNGVCPKGLCDGESQYEVLEKPFAYITTEHIKKWALDHAGIAIKCPDRISHNLEEINSIASFLISLIERVGEVRPDVLSGFYQKRTLLPVLYNQSSHQVEKCKRLVTKAKLGKGRGFGVSQDKRTAKVNDELGDFESLVQDLKLDWQFRGISKEPVAEKASYLRKYFKPSELADAIPGRLFDSILRLADDRREDLPRWHDVVFELSNIEGLSYPSFSALRARAMTEAKGLMGTRKNSRKESFIREWGKEKWKDECEMDDLDPLEQMRCAQHREEIKNLVPNEREWEKALRNTVEDQFERLIGD